MGRTSTLKRHSSKKGREVACRRAFVIAAAAALCALSLMAAPSLAQTPSPPQAERGLQILLLGTHGGPALDRQRSEPATLLIVDGRPYLIDCGIGTMRRLLEAGVPSQSIAAIFITHNHPDHDLGLVDLLANDYHHLALDAPQSRQQFDIYGPPQTPALVRAAWNYIRIPYGIFAAEPIGKSTLIDPFRAHAIDRDGVVYRDDRIRVTAAENTHYQLMPARYHASMKSFSYRFDTPYGSVVFTGDTGPSPAVEALAKDADVLISEVEDLNSMVRDARAVGTAGNADALVRHMRAEHLPMQAVGTLASRAGVKAVILDHFLGGNDDARFVAGVKQYYRGPVFAGADLARYCMAAATTAAHGGGRGAVARRLAPCP